MDDKVWEIGLTIIEVVIKWPPSFDASFKRLWWKLALPHTFCKIQKESQDYSRKQCDTAIFGKEYITNDR